MMRRPPRSVLLPYTTLFRSVLVPQFVGDILEILSHVLSLEREVRDPAGFLGQVFQHLVAIAFDAAHIRRDGVDRHFVLDGPLQRLIARVAALVVVAVAQNYDGAAKIVPGLVLSKFVAAGEVKGVIQRRPAARP